MPAGGDLEVLIVGAGFGGIAAAIELQKHGFQDITILEAGAGIGGTWLYNTYPGAACDVPSHLYSFSFAQRRDWPRLCPMQREILAYLREVAHEFGVDRYVQTDTEVASCTWERERRRWIIKSSDGRHFQADAIVIATGQLHKPAFPLISGGQTFTGHTFHSAHWDHGYDLQDKRVAVIGTGASAVQFVPQIAKQAGEVTIFQRTGNWFLPRKNLPYPRPVRELIKRVPRVQEFRRKFVFHYGETLTFLIRHPRTFGRVGQVRSAIFMRSQLKDPALRRKIWPDYTFGCKRVLFSSHFLLSLQRENIQVITEPIECMTPTGIVSVDGIEHEVDCVIYATGFHTNDFMFPMQIIGVDGRTLHEAWADGPHAHLGMTVAGFPSMFVMYGPNTNTSGGSIIVYLEAQAAYLRQALQYVRARGATAIDVRPEVQASSDRQTQASFAGTAWVDCDSWYRDDRGRIVANWPGYMREYMQRTKILEPSEFELMFEFGKRTSQG